MKSWHLDRRTFLHGVGVSLALPWLECMATSQNPATPPRRMGFVYFPFGVPTPPAGNPNRLQYGWFPVGQGREYQFTGTHQSLTPYRAQITYLGGLSHPLGRRVPGHKAGDVYLTGADVSGTAYRQSVSVDQVAAASIGDQTRFPSLILSSSGGVNVPYRSFTLSYDQGGRPIPAEHRPRDIFNRLFGAAQQSRALQNQASILDAVRDEAQSLNNRLGARDRAQLDQYLSSVREAERRVANAERWLASERTRVDPAAVNVEVGPDGPRDLIRSMFDLIVLALQTDATRIFTYQMGSESEGGCVSSLFPHAVGIRKNGHQISHDRANYQQWSNYSRFLTDQYAYFLGRLRSIPEGNGTLLDNTMSLFGCCTSVTHVTRNYPLILAGGANMGIRHGQFRRYGDDVPLSNLFVTMLDRMQVPARSFKDSTGELRDILS